MSGYVDKHGKVTYTTSHTRAAWDNEMKYDLNPRSEWAPMLLWNEAREDDKNYRWYGVCVGYYFIGWVSRVA